ncbi:MAG: thioredoxin TrxA [Oceanobacter sp.]
MSELILKITDDSFESEVLNNDKPVLVDFWAEWCGPCKMIAPVLEDIAEDFEGSLVVAKLNIDENQETAPKYGIRSIPTLLIFKEGVVAATKIGAMSKSELVQFINSNI